MSPIYSTALESYSSVYAITCGELMYSYVAAKSEHKRPDETADLADKIMTCFTASVAKVEESPCNQLRQSYADCLSSKSGRRSCAAIRSKLQDCTAKHVGRLDD